MTVALYVRVSTDEQADQGFSIDVQKERLIAFSKSQGWEDYKLYIDDGYTGTKLDRPAMNRLIRHIEEKKITTVCVYKLDRLGRKQKDVLYLLEDVFEKNGVAFKSSTEPFDTSTPFGKAMTGVLAVFAQLERDMIIERTTSGRREKLSQGQWSGGRIAFGYNWNKDAKQLEIVPEEAQLVREMYRMFLQGQTYSAIADWMNNRTKARYFDHGVVKEMISRPLYNGKLISAGAIVEGNHEAIIEDEVWLSAQREKGKRKDGLPPVGEYLLTGLLECGVCGGPVVHVKRITRKYGKTYEYHLYACKNQHVRRKDRNTNCTLGYVRRDVVEGFVESYIKEMSVSRKKFQTSIGKRTEEISDDAAIDSLQEKLDKVTSGLENLYDAIQSGEVKASSLSSRIKKLEEEREAIERQLDDLSNSKPKSKEPGNVYFMVKQISDRWDQLTEEERKIVLRQIVSKVTLQKDDDPEITWNTRA